MLDAVLCLTHALVSGGPWWEQARAKYPLLPVEALYTTSRVGKEGLCTKGYMRVVSEVHLYACKLS
jgi:hypothetical protein